MATNPTAFTVDDVLELEPPNGVRAYEFVDGQPVPLMHGSPIHGKLIVEVAYRLRLDPERLFRGVPDLAIEVDLASRRKPGGQQRIVDYLEAGVQLVWSIDPHSRTAIVYHTDGSARLVRSDEELDGEDVVPGFRLKLAELFSTESAH